MIALLIVAMVASLWIGPGSARLASYTKFYVGLAVFTFAISAVFALLNLITGFLVGAGARQFGPGSILAVLWSGFAPVTAVVVLHLLFKHVLRVLSPFKLVGRPGLRGCHRRDRRRRRSRLRTAPHPCPVPRRIPRADARGTRLAEPALRPRWPLRPGIHAHAATGSEAADRGEHRGRPMPPICVTQSGSQARFAPGVSMVDSPRPE